MKQYDSHLVTAHLPCEACGSSDAKALYSNGSSYCFSCNTSIKEDTTTNNKTQQKSKYKSTTNNINFIKNGKAQGLSKRFIEQRTAFKWSYQVGKDKNSKTVQIANYYNSKNEIVAQKTRDKDKNFSFIGNTSQISLYGQWLWEDEKYKNSLIIVEGEIDALTIDQVYSGRRAVVSVPLGVTSSKKICEKELEWIESFNTIIVGLDNDKAGQDTLDKLVDIFTPGKVKICVWRGAKDPNELLIKGDTKAILESIANAKSYRPDGIVLGNYLWDIINKEDSYISYKIPYPILDNKISSLRKGELITFTAGSGIGKSTLVKEIAYHLMVNHNLNIGYVALEESIRKSALNFMSLYLNKPLHINGRDSVSNEEFKKAFDVAVGNDKLYLYDHFGSMESDNLLNKLRYLAVATHCDFIILDHISIVISGSSSADDNERRAIDKLMTDIRSLVEDTGVGILIVSHLKRPEGSKGHEEGARVTLAQLRGSGAIAQLSDIVIGIERNQQAVGNENISTIRVLKNRFSGKVGEADTLEYSKETGRLLSTNSDKKKTKKVNRQQQKEVNSDF